MNSQGGSVCYSSRVTLRWQHRDPTAYRLSERKEEPQNRIITMGKGIFVSLGFLLSKHLFSPSLCCLHFFLLLPLVFPFRAVFNCLFQYVSLGLVLGVANLTLIRYLGESLVGFLQVTWDGKTIGGFPLERGSRTSRKEQSE